MKLPQDIKEKAIILRKKGYSLEEISKKLKISKSTASYWLSKIRLNQKAQDRLKQRGILGQYKTILLSEIKRKKLFNKIRVDVKKDLSKISLSPKLARYICSILFWCEGSKNNYTTIKFTNSDPAMIKGFLSTFRLGFNINEQKLRALVHLHEYHNENKQIQFWSNVSKIPINQFFRSYNKPHTGKRIKNGYQGCLAISYHDAKLAKILWTYYNELQNQFIK